MTAVLGIDAAWTATEPRGVARIEPARRGWRVMRVAPSCDAFVARDRVGARFLEGAATGFGDGDPAIRVPNRRADAARE